jgi:hypothetical protein
MPSPAFLLAALTVWIFAFPLYGRAEGAYLWLWVFSPGLCGGEWPGQEKIWSIRLHPLLLFFLPLDLWATGKAQPCDTYFSDGKGDDHAAGPFPDFGGSEVVF